MFVKTHNGQWTDGKSCIFLRNDGGSNLWFDGREDNWHSFAESPDELAALLNGAAQQAPRMVELTRDNGSNWFVDAGCVASVVDARDECAYVTMRGELNECYRVIGTYADIKRVLFGAEDGE